jgi:hypothetical protein
MILCRGNRVMNESNCWRVWLFYIVHRGRAVHKLEQRNETSNANIYYYVPTNITIKILVARYLTLFYR